MKKFFKEAYKTLMYVFTIAVLLATAIIYVVQKSIKNA